MDKIIRFESQKETQGLLGAQDANLKIIQKEFKVKLTLRGEHLKISGSAAQIKKTNQLIEYLLAGLRSGNAEISQTDLVYLISNLKKDKESLQLEQLDTGIIRSCAGKPIGLLQAQDILKEIEGIKFIYFSGSDVVRHSLV